MTDTDLIQLPPLNVVAVYSEKPGVFIHIEDVVDRLVMMAELAKDDARDALREAAEWFAAAQAAIPSPEGAEAATRAVDAPGDPFQGEAAVVGVPAAPNPEVALVARIETYQDDTGRWYARPIDKNGFILWNLDPFEGTQREHVENLALDAWGRHLSVYDVGDAMGDSLWQENQEVSTGLVRTAGSRRPSPRRMFAR